MPIDVRFDDERRMLHVRVSAEWPTLPEIVAERSRLILAGYIRSDIVELVDARALTRGISELVANQRDLEFDRAAAAETSGGG